MNRVRCAVIGIGYLGKFHAGKYQSLENAELVAVCDSIPFRADQFAQEFNTSAYYDYCDLIGKVDAVSIVTPTSTHYQIAKFFLEHNIHVLLEKPMTSTITEADELIALAKKHRVILQIGHLERFNNALIAIEPLVIKPNLIESRRLTTFKPRGIDINVVLDLMIHDLDIILHLMQTPIKFIRAHGQKLVTNNFDVCHAHIEFENHSIANLTASRVSLHNERQMQIFQDNGLITCDFNTKQITQQKKHPTNIAEIECDEQTLEQGDAILAEIAAFLDSITYKKPAVVSGEDGRLALTAAVSITSAVNDQLGSAIDSLVTN